jgi:alpha-ketoglutarate-dependent taurine dioxygenase
MLILARMMRPVLEPSNIYAHRHEEQDVILWYNRALWHSIVGSSLVLSFKTLTVTLDRVSRVLWAQNYASMQYCSF